MDFGSNRRCWDLRQWGLTSLLLAGKTRQAKAANENDNSSRSEGEDEDESDDKEDVLASVAPSAALVLSQLDPEQLQLALILNRFFFPALHGISAI